MEMFRSVSELFGHSRTFYQLQLVKFQHIERQGGKSWGLCQNFLTRLSGKPQYHVSSDQNSPCGSLPNSQTRRCEVVPAIDALQSPVAGTLNAKLQHDKSRVRQRCQIIVKVRRHTVRPGRNHKAQDTIHGQSLLKPRTEHFQGAISVGIRLEISKVTH